MDRYNVYVTRTYYINEALLYRRQTKVVSNLTFEDSVMYLKIQYVDLAIMLVRLEEVEAKLSLEREYVGLYMVDEDTTRTYHINYSISRIY